MPAALSEETDADGTETQKGGGLHVFDDIDQISKRGAFIVGSGKD